jgi:dTDP-4-dehydrorhamnose reductase
MRVLVTGKKGQLGHDVLLQLEKRQIECQGVDIDDFDLTDPEAVSGYIARYRPTIVVHCAAYTAVERAETERDICFAVNVTGTENIARACLKVGSALVYISTDYVFDGVGDRPYEVNDAKDPQSQYGLTKSLGEDKVREIIAQAFIIRTAWVFGKNGSNFVKTMLRLGQEKPEINVVADQFGSPTYTQDLACLICDMIMTAKYGVYHATNEGFCSWYEFACAIVEEAGLPAKINPITSEQYPTPVKRPKNSRLSKVSLDHAGFMRLPDWRDALRRYIMEICED